MTTNIERTTFQSLPATVLTLSEGPRAIVSDHGAQVLSWQPAPGDERLYLSARSGFGAGAAIRGGIPVIFPQFALRGPGARHGLARTVAWEFADSRAGRGFVTATWRLPLPVPDLATGETRRVECELTVNLEERRMDLELHVANPEGSIFTFGAALHTYLRVPDIAQASLVGLQDTPYENQAAGGTWHTQEARFLRVEGEIDRVYREAPAATELMWRGGATRVRQEGFVDTVVWNPGQAKCAQLGDMPPDGYREFLCVEAACVHEPVRLAPGEAWSGRQTLLAD